jgi:hypothetical protein
MTAPAFLSLEYRAYRFYRFDRPCRFTLIPAQHVQLPQSALLTLAPAHRCRFSLERSASTQ